MLCALPLALSCCLPASAPSDRAAARGAVLAVADAVRAADAVCAAYVTDTHDRATGQVCVNAYQTARDALTTSAAVLDGLQAGDAVCPLLAAAGQLETLVGATHGRPLPPVVGDALTLANALKGGCHDAG